MRGFTSRGLTKAEYYRRYAAELRAVAEGSAAKDNETLMRVADSLEQMAHAAEGIAHPKSCSRSYRRTNSLDEAISERVIRFDARLESIALRGVSRCGRRSMQQSCAQGCS